MCWYRTPRFLLYTGAGRRVRTHGHLSKFTDRETAPYSTVELYANVQYHLEVEKISSACAALPRE